MCFGEVTDACVGIDASNPQNSDPSVFVDGEAIETKKVVDTPPQKTKRTKTKKQSKSGAKKAQKTAKSEL